jgi:NAD-dependent dihydropyrimidine dehydrogenase PreA subunit
MDCTTEKSILPGPERFDPEEDCPVDWVKRLMDAARSESCGKCVLCREGTLQVFTIAADIAQGEGLPEDTVLVSELLGLIRNNGGCEMAVEAATRCLSVLKAAPERWEQHIGLKRCTALVCRDLITPFVLPSLCGGCGQCEVACPNGVITGGAGMIRVIDPEKCHHCLSCLMVCPNKALIKTSGLRPKGPAVPIPVGTWDTGDRSVSLRRRRRPQGDNAGV